MTAKVGLVCHFSPALNAYTEDDRKQTLLQIMKSQEQKVPVTSRLKKPTLPPKTAKQNLPNQPTNQKKTQTNKTTENRPKNPKPNNKPTKQQNKQKIKQTQTNTPKKQERQKKAQNVLSLLFVFNVPIFLCLGKEQIKIKSTLCSKLRQR